jgi:hypothetical protein
LPFDRLKALALSEVEGLVVAVSLRIRLPPPGFVRPEADTKPGAAA